MCVAWVGLSVRRWEIVMSVRSGEYVMVSSYVLRGLLNGLESGCMKQVRLRWLVRFSCQIVLLSLNWIFQSLSDPRGDAIWPARTSGMISKKTILEIIDAIRVTPLVPSSLDEWWVEWNLLLRLSLRLDLLWLSHINGLVRVMMHRLCL